MVAPILAILGGLGILGGSSLIQRKTRAQSQARANAPFQAALNSQLSGAPLPAGQEGPTQNQTGFSQEQQSIVLGLMQNGNSEAAFNQGQKFQAQNTAARNLSFQEGIQSASVALQNQAFGQSQKQFDFDVAGRLAETAEARRLTAEATAGLLDSELGAKQAGLRGDTEYAHLDAQTGQTQILPIDGTATFNAGEDALGKSGDLLARLNDARDSVNRFDVTGDPSSDVTRDLQSNLTIILLELKELFNLGVLSGNDEALLLRVLPDPTTLSAQAFSDAIADGVALTNASEILEAANARNLAKTKDWVGLDTGLQQRAIDAQRGAQKLDERSNRFLVHSQQQQPPDEPLNQPPAALFGSQTGLLRQIGLLGAGIPGAIGNIFR